MVVLLFSTWIILDIIFIEMAELLIGWIILIAAILIAAIYFKNRNIRATFIASAVLILALGLLFIWNLNNAFKNWSH